MPESAFRILLVEDSDDDRKLLVRELSKSDAYEVDFAFEAPNAISQAMKTHPDVILLDMGIPAGGGLAVLNWLSLRPELLRIPVIVWSGTRRHNLLDHLKQYTNVRGYVEKSGGTEWLVGMLSIMKHSLDKVAHKIKAQPRYA